MKTALVVIALMWWFAAAAPSATLEMTAGPDLTVRYDPVLWKLVEPARQAEQGLRQSARWQIESPEWVQITVTSDKEAQTESQHKKDILKIQKMRGDPAEFVGERHESLAGRDWLVLAFRNRSTRPSRSEIHYFLSTDEGYVSVFVIGEEATLPKHREAIEGFLQNVQVK